MQIEFVKKLFNDARSKTPCDSARVILAHKMAGSTSMHKDDGGKTARWMRQTYGATAVRNIQDYEIYKSMRMEVAPKGFYRWRDVLKEMRDRLETGETTGMPPAMTVEWCDAEIISCNTEYATQKAAGNGRACSQSGWKLMDPLVPVDKAKIARVVAKAKARSSDAVVAAAARGRGTLAGAMGSSLGGSAAAAAGRTAVTGGGGGTGAKKTVSSADGSGRRRGPAAPPRPKI